MCEDHYDLAEGVVPLKPLIAAMIVGAVAWFVGTFHPFSLAMPWQTGDSASVNRTLQQIMSDSDLDLVDATWGRITPFNYVAANADFVGEGQPSLTCSDLRDALDSWGRVVDSTRKANGCIHDAVGPGPMTARIEVTEGDRRQLRVDVKVQHAP